MKKILFLFLIVLLSSCVVSKKKYELQKSISEKLKADKDDCLETNKNLETKIAEVNIQNTELTKHLDFLKVDSALKHTQIGKLKNMYNELLQLYNELNDEKEELKKFSTKQKELQQEVILQREKAIEGLKRQMFALQEEMVGTKENEKVLTGKLTAREQRIEELEQSIIKQDSLLNSIKEQILAALIGYHDSILSVKEKDGKLYVTISDKLLFKQGSITVDKLGADAIRKLSKSLEKLTDYYIYIEGHTDSVRNIPNSGCIQDNWDLSVLRATSVLKILKENKEVKLDKIIPCGRAYFVKAAIGSSPEDLIKNRRTEIILSPDYKKLLEKLSE